MQSQAGRLAAVEFVYPYGVPAGLVIVGSVLATATLGGAFTTSGAFVTVRNGGSDSPSELAHSHSGGNVDAVLELQGFGFAIHATIGDVHNCTSTLQTKAAGEVI